VVFVFHSFSYFQLYGHIISVCSYLQSFITLIFVIDWFIRIYWDLSIWQNWESVNGFPQLVVGQVKFMLLRSCPNLQLVHPDSARSVETFQCRLQPRKRSAPSCRRLGSPPALPPILGIPYPGLLGFSHHLLPVPNWGLGRPEGSLHSDHKHQPQGPDWTSPLTWWVRLQAVSHYPAFHLNQPLNLHVWSDRVVRRPGQAPLGFEYHEVSSFSLSSICCGCFS